MSYKKWGVSLIALLLCALVLLGAVTVIIDPYFHYHAPLNGLEYRIYYQRYQNDGILKNFDYNAVITGNSMCENFKSSECDALFGVHSVKVPFSGASSKELDQSNRTAIAANDALSLIIMDIDADNLITDKDMMSYAEEDYPTFLYDDNPFNDVKYIFNKSIFKASLDVISYTLSGQRTTSFDDYSFWDTPGVPYGRDIILMTYTRPTAMSAAPGLTEAQRALVRGNVTQNLVQTARENPEVEFYLFFPAFSMYYWDKQQRLGMLYPQLEAQREAAELLLECENIKLFSFMDEYELVQDYSRYKDYIHYDSAVNSYMLECMAAGEHRLTRENYEAFFDEVFSFYTEFDYDALFSEE